MVNSRLTVAIHVLCLLACQRGDHLTSECIAGSVNTNPVVIRRLLATLRKAGLVRSQGGAAGGWELLRGPESITLLEVYKYVNPGAVFAMHNKTPNPRCLIGKNIQRGLVGYFMQAQAGLERELGKVTIAQVLGDVMAGAKAD